MIAKTSLLLNTPVRNGVEELASAVVTLQLQLFETQQAQRSAREQVIALDREHDRLLDLLAHLKSDEYKTPDSIIEDTAQWLKGAKHLRAKIGEYDERLIATRPVQPLLSLIKEVGDAVSDGATVRAQLVAIADELDALKTFPAHPAAAKKLLAQAKEELSLLIADRESIHK
ncbi:hypothetical protein AMS68_005745 [Peltaster fructicola]|uniref:Uncharacterized protein n=1 Tax=Peltaster fructicola TaxID=286661 RepID=A0A6H0Y060_9PEZI|nr:hypothetical protein AMS68_005745 [Peltaster fructicola]